MTLHPIQVVEEVTNEYEDYILTEFRARDERLRDELEGCLRQPGFLAQEPFFQAHRPFKDGARWKELPLDPKLAEVMRQRSDSERAYLHQSEAVQHLLGSNPSNLVITTGTGSGKTECFLLPVIQNAIADAAKFKESGLTAILVYPMNALANDQETRILDYLKASGHTYVKVARYDRSTKEEERQALRQSPPHILLTNYMMLEYLLVRPADREGLFANHRCRFIVLDEVHSYRGALGANIALLFRRTREHLRRAKQTYAADAEPARRFPSLLAVATSATIKSVDEVGLGEEDRRQRRDAAVRELMTALTGFAGESFRVLGEEQKLIVAPSDAAWGPSTADLEIPSPRDPGGLRRCASRLAGLAESTPLEEASRRSAILWYLADQLARKPLAVSQIVELVKRDAPGRLDVADATVAREIEAALVLGAALPDGTPGALRLRTHRFIRGDWRFSRCTDPACARLYAMGETNCGQCGRPAAPLLLCRSCGADALHFVGGEDPAAGKLQPHEPSSELEQWVLYDRNRLEVALDEDVDVLLSTSLGNMKGRPSFTGSFDPATGSFSVDESTYPVKVALAPERNRCLVCGAMAGAGTILTRVALGTSAAVRVMTEGVVEALARQHAVESPKPRKERVLIFSDSRQDAAHQARFISYAGRYDRMRRRLISALREGGGSLSLAETVHRLMELGVRARDNPTVAQKYSDAEFLPESARRRAMAWEEAPLLDDLAVSAGYRATVFNLGLVGVEYENLRPFITKKGAALASQLGVSIDGLCHLSRCLLDEIRTRRALSTPHLQYHPGSPSFPEELRYADWERRVKAPQGFAWDPAGKTPTTWVDSATIEDGVTLNNFWRKEGGGGRGPSVERRFKHLLSRLGGVHPSSTHLQAWLELVHPLFLTSAKLHGWRKASELLQLNADVVRLVLLEGHDRGRCSICNVRLAWAPLNAPCPSCAGSMRPWAEEEIKKNRYARRILDSTGVQALVAAEHTAQITGDERMVREEDFKGELERSPLNVLACSPTLEMGIDVGGLDAVVMRNVPPRPDNYAQRGGRAGRRTRVGIVLGYARSTPHDAYFYDRPEEMIAGAVAAPPIGLGNRDVVLRHINAIAMGAAEPGLSGRMGTYVSIKGELEKEPIEALIAAFSSRFDYAAEVAVSAFGPEILGQIGLSSKEAVLSALTAQPGRFRDLFERVGWQVLELQKRVDQWAKSGVGPAWSAGAAMDLTKRLLGIPSDNKDRDADDRSAGHPMRRFAEFGILPGYEFPSEPATVRLLRDEHEEEPLTVVRRFGLAQYQPDAPVHARGHRWKVVGLDPASPWNPRTEDPGWLYTLCGDCGLRFTMGPSFCPRCGTAAGLAKPLPGYEFGGFVAVRDDNPVLSEEDRFSARNLLHSYPQWNGDVVGRFALPTDWGLQLRRGEEVRWLNEGPPPTPAERARGVPILHEDGRGFLLCSACGQILKSGDKQDSKGKGQKKPKKAEDDPYGHSKGCVRGSQAPFPLAITTKSASMTLRILVDLPLDYAEETYQRWGYTLGYSLRTGLRQLYMLDGAEVEFDLEPMWRLTTATGKWKRGALTFIDPAIGGSGFLERAARELHLVAARAVEHLKHGADCNSACYRCLKSYQNQRHHQLLSWPHVLPDLESLASAPPVALPAEVGDIHDPKPWLEAYAAGVGSPLELKFLRLFEQHGVVVEKQVAVGPTDSGPPISVADFRVKGTRTLVYVDGSAFHAGAALRRDRNIRDRLAQGTAGWKVISFRAANLAAPDAVIHELAFAASHEAELPNGG